jgi:pimeloyl-ACP methyl ester carboxylesterase
MKVVDMNTIEVNGVKLSLEVEGKGPTVIFIHGIPTDYRVWKPQVNRLSAKFHTISYSRRCAWPNMHSDYMSSTVENNARDLEELINRVDGGSVHLVSHSYGGPIAASYVLKHPEKVQSLTLIEPDLPGVVVDQRNRAETLALVNSKPSIAKSGKESLDNIKTTLQEVFQNHMDKALDLYYPRTWENNDAKVKLTEQARAMMVENMETFKELMTEPPTFNKVDASRITRTTLILGGQYTTEWMKAVASELHENVPNNQITIIQNTAHYPHIENPRDCSEAIFKFLSEHAL